VVFTKAPIAHEQPVSTARTAGGRVRELVRRFKGAALREVLLRDGYLYSEDPVEALALVREVELDDLFDEPHIWLLRGDKLERLERHPVRRRFEYRFSDGEPATLLLFDRVATHPTALRKPLHRDIRALKQRAGFDRLRVVHMTERALVAELTFGKERVTGLIQSDGARLDLSCFDAPPEKRRAITRHLEATEGQREALAKLQAAAEALVREHMPFDRPREVEDHLSDGELRPLWEDAYRHGRQGFQHEEKSYLVFDEKGRPTPPQTCVAMILDAYERASGRWYRPRGEKAGRTDGRLDFTELGIGNRAGVISFEEFAGTLPKLFETYRFEGKERILFRDRKRFFEGIMAHERAFLPGDIIAIHGPKPDGYIHQHAILIVDTDPLTGFPYLMVDQMRLPRFRTFEGIMAEAPLRSLFYQVRPKAELWALLKTPPNPPPTGGVSRLGP
jgi:hypothetical protein